MKIEQRGRFYTAQGGDPASLRDSLISRYNLGENYSFFVDLDNFMVAMPPCATMMWLKTHSTNNGDGIYVTDLQEFKS